MSSDAVVRSLTLSFAGNAITVFALSWASTLGDAPWVAPVIALVAIAANAWRHAKVRPYRTTRSSELIAVALGFAAVGLAFAVPWALGLLPEWAGTAGVIAVLFGGGEAIVTLRYLPAWRAVGPRLAMATAGVFVLGLLVTSVDDAPWGLALVGLAVVLTPLPLGLASARLLPTIPTATQPSTGDRLPPTLVMLLGAAAFLVHGAGLAVWSGVPAPSIFAVFVVLAVLVWALTANFILDVIGIAVVFAIVFSAPGPGESLVEKVTPVDGDQVIVALGDSYISGEGAKSFIAGTNHRQKPANECRRANTAYPVAVAATTDGSYPGKLAFLACSGAKVGNVLRRDDETNPARANIQVAPQYSGEPVDGPEGGQTQLEQWDALVARQHLKPIAVLLSIGGNDAMFGDIGKTCALPGSCVEMGTVWLDNLQKVSDRLDAAYAEISTTFKGVPVAVLPYPIPINEKKCSWSPLTAREHQFLARFTHALNDVVHQAAKRHGFAFLVEAEAVLGPPNNLRICDTKRPESAGINFFGLLPVDGSLSERLNVRHWFHNSFHPNMRGHAKVADVARSWLKLRSVPTRDPSAQPRVVTLRRLLQTSTVPNCANAESAPRSCRATTGQYAIAQGTKAVWHASWAFLSLGGAAWLLSLEAVRRWRKRGT